MIASCRPNAVGAAVLRLFIATALCSVLIMPVRAQDEPDAAERIAELEATVWEQTPPSHGAVRTLGSMGPAAIPALIRMMRSHPGGDIRFLSQIALAEVGEAAVEPMRQVLRDGDPSARMAAVLGLEKVLGADVVPVLQPLLADPSGGVVARAAGALLRITGDADTYLPPLVDVLRTGAGGDRWIAAESLDWCKQAAAGAVPDLIEALDTSPPGVRARALTALRNIGTREAVAAVALEHVPELGSDDVWTRLRAAHALGGAGEAAAPALPALRERLADAQEDMLVRGYCAWAADQVDPHSRPARPRTFHVRRQAPNASDDNPGTMDAPWRTIQRAAEEMHAGDTVIIGEGTYREFVRPFRGGESYDRMVTYRAAPGEQVILKGSDVWEPAWERAQVGDTTVWAAPWERLPWDHPEQWPSPRSGPMHRAEQVFVDGRLMTHVETREGLATNTGAFYTDDTERRLYLRLPEDEPPQGRLIERSMRQQVFAPAVRGLGYIRVQGLSITHAANPESSGANWSVIGHRAALSTRRGHHWIIEDNHITWANAQGMDVGGEGWSQDLQKQPPVSNEPGFHQVRRNEVSHNGVAGIVGWGGGVTRLLLEDNVTNFNALNGNFYAYESAGVKLHGTDHVIIRRHRAHGNEAFGIWVDYLCHHTRITQCIVTDNRGAGIFVEVSSQGPNLVDSNVVIGTRDAQRGGWGDGLYSHDADDVTWANNLVLNCRGWGVRLTRCIGRTTSWGETSVNRHRVLNNIISGNERGAVNLRPEAPLSEDNLSDHNVLWGHDGAPVCGVNNSGINVDWGATEVGPRMGLTGSGSLTLPLPRWQEYGQDRASIALPADVLLGDPDTTLAPEASLEPLVTALTGLWDQDFGLDDGVGEYRPRPAAAMVAALSDDLRGATLAHQFMLSPTAGIQTWERDREPVLVAWDWEGEATITLPGLARPVHLAPTPAFVRGAAPLLLAPQQDGLVAQAMSASGGELTTVQLPAGFAAHAVASLNATVQGEELRLHPAPGAAPGAYSVLVAGAEGWGLVPVAVVEALAIEGIEAVWRDGPHCLLRVRNRLGRAVDCRVELQDGEDRRQADLALPAQGTGEVSLSLPTERGFVQARIRAALPGGATAEGEALLGTAIATRRAADDMTAGWDDLPRYSLDDFPGGFFPESLRQAVADKPGDLSARFASRWDDRALYLRVEVVDDVHCQAQPAGEAWEEDSVQLLVEHRPPEGTARRLELDVDLPAADGAGPRIFGRQGPGVEPLPPEAVAGIEADVQRAEHRTTYTVSIPWTSLGPGAPPPAGSGVGLAIVVNDDDDDGRGRHGLQWFFGIHGFRGQYHRMGTLWLAP